ncbi:heat shock 70 kDa protein-like [Zophobas morio]|uniref:heat shock 70 kDa protein-like n=1 Tax=Zophobas morio TaxID=2755281 RepID=UPI003083C46D
MHDLVIGIDLGTTNSCVSLYLNGRVKVIENDAEGRITPSFIYFSADGGITIGEHAKKMAVLKPEHGIYEIKRLVGRKYDDSKLQKSIEWFSFQVTSDEANLPVVCVEQDGEISRKTPQELYTILLRELKRDVEEKLETTINKVVITVPAYFNVKQREVTLEAAENAGFTVLKLLNEPTAAALAYYFDNKIHETHFSLVFDLGGGTFDAAVLQQRLDNIEVLSVAGDTQLGGHDFDSCILEHVCQILQDEHNYDPKNDADDKRRLKKKCEEAKKELSSTDETTIVLNGMVPDCPKLRITITRKQFESMAEQLFQKTIDILHLCLQNSKVPKSEIQAVILCGGSTRIPKIQEMITEYFDGIKLNKFVNPNECVAEGAALQAAMLSKSSKQKIEMLKMVDVVPISLGFNDLGNEMVFLINRNTKIPMSASINYTTTYNNQSGFDLGIYEGERSDARKNRYLGNLSMDGLTPAPPGQVEVIATLTLDHNGILTAKAEEKCGGNFKELQVKYTPGDRSESEIHNTLLDAENNKENDEKFREFCKLKIYLINYCTSITYNLENMGLVDDYEEIYDFCNETEDVLDQVEMDKMTQLKTLIDKCRVRCHPLVQRHNFESMPELS